MENVLTNQGSQGGCGNYQVRIDEQVFTLRNPEPTGREILAMIRRDPADFLLTLVVAGEPDIIVETDETIDLTAPGTEQFALVSKRRHYSLGIDERSFSITNPTPTGRELLALVGKMPETHLLNLNLPYEDDELVDADETVDLRKPGREQFAVTVKNPLTIVIDDVRYQPAKSHMTGAELRGLPKPPLGSDRDLWLDVAGKDDRRILPDTSVELKDCMVFYTAPTTINPGRHI